MQKKYTSRMNFIKRNINKKLRCDNLYIASNLSVTNQSEVSRDTNTYLPAKQSETKNTYDVFHYVNFINPDSSVNKKILEITSDGIKVNGRISATNEIIAYGDSSILSDASITFPASDVDLLINWSDYDNTTADETALSAKLGYDLYTRILNVSVSDVDLSNYYTKTDASNLFQPKGDYVRLNTLTSDYYTKNYIDTSFITKTDASNLFQPKGDYVRLNTLTSDYYTKNYIDSSFYNKQYCDDNFIDSLSVGGNYLYYTKKSFAAKSGLIIPYATKAAYLNTSRKIWGQYFNGSSDVTGAMSGVTNINQIISLDSSGIKINGRILATGEITAYAQNDSAESNLLTSFPSYNSATGDKIALSAKLGKYLYDTCYFKQAYNFYNGIMISFDINVNSAVYMNLHINGNPQANNLYVINSELSFFWSGSNQKVMNYSLIHYGYNFGNIMIGRYKENVVCWFKPPRAGQTYRFYAESNTDATQRIIELRHTQQPTFTANTNVTVLPYSLLDEIQTMKNKLATL